jgi:hypothetical protein
MNALCFTASIDSGRLCSSGWMKMNCAEIEAQGGSSIPEIRLDLETLLAKVCSSSSTKR